MMRQLIDLDRYPIDQPGTAAFDALVAQCQAALDGEGLFNLPGFMRADAISDMLAQVKPMIAKHAFTHQRDHNVFFDDDFKDLPPNHPALRRYKTTNHTICADQIEGSPVVQLYDWPPLAAFLAAVMDKPALYPMDDRIACANVMTYYDGEALNWHFDRSEFTTTLLLQAPHAGGEFEYVKDLRSPGNPNFEGIAALWDGKIDTKICPQSPGTLNVFKGVNTAHRVTPVQGKTPRINAVLTYYENPGARFTRTERLGFYGRDTEWQP